MIFQALFRTLAQRVRSPTYSWCGGFLVGFAPFVGMSLVCDKEDDYKKFPPRVDNSWRGPMCPMFPQYPNTR